MKINILDLFSGIGGFSKGFMDAGFEIENHYFSEIDLHAIANYKYNFKDSQYVGTVEHVYGGGIERPHIITFGSPCQDFSLAGKRKGLDGDRSSLIEHAIASISYFQPELFIWENVKGAFSSNNGEDFWAIIQAFTNIGGYTIEWQLLNTAWVLPQNRERIYLIGHLATSKRNWRKVFPIGENDSAFIKTNKAKRDWFQAKHCSTLQLKYGNRPTDTFVKCKDIANTLTGGGNSGGLHSDMTTQCIDMKSLKSTTRRGMIKENESHTLDCQSNLAVGAIRGRNPDNPSDRTAGANLKQTLEMNSNNITNTLTSVHKDNVVVGTLRTHKDGQGFRQVSDNNCPTIPARAREDGSGQPVISEGVGIRRLTEIECERLQGFADNWTMYGLYPTQRVSQKQFNEMPNSDRIRLFDDTEKRLIASTQRYKMLGNAVTKDIVELIATRLKENINI